MRYEILITIIVFCVLLVSCSDTATVADDNTNTRKFTIKGDSMQPALKNGQVVQVAGRFVLSRDDIVVIKFSSVDELYVKRAIALENDEIIFGKDGFLYVNGSRSRKYDAKSVITLSKQLDFYNNKVPKGYFIAMGDNVDSFDSGAYGLVPVEYIMGKVLI